jgi:hypothetical protein
MSPLATKIVSVATGKVGSNDWAYDREKDNFGKNTNKCNKFNKFVYDVMVEAGVQPPPSIPRYLIFSRPPTAGEWATPSTTIDGWVVVETPAPGDVVAEAHNYSDATGHVGIVVGDKLTASASALVNGQIVQNDWGFRSDNKPTFRRYSRS